MFLYREVYYAGEKLDDDSVEEIDKNKTELIVAKNRHGETGTIELVFDSEYTRSRSLETDERYS